MSEQSHQETGLADLERRLTQAEETLATVHSEVSVLRAIVRERKAKVFQQQKTSSGDSSTASVQKDCSITVPHFNPESPILTKVKRRLVPKGPDQVDMPISDDTYNAIEGIGRSGVVSLAMLNRPKLILFASLLQADGYELSIDDIKGYAKSTLTQAMHAVRHAIALSSVQIHRHHGGRVSLRSASADDVKIESEELRTSLEEILKQRLEAAGYIPAEDNISNTSPSLLKGLTFVLEHLRSDRRVVSVPFETLQEVTGARTTRADEVATHISTLFPGGAITTDHLERKFLIRDESEEWYL